jgi:hypothetical protein
VSQYRSPSKSLNPQNRSPQKSRWLLLNSLEKYHIQGRDSFRGNENVPKLDQNIGV